MAEAVRTKSKTKSKIKKKTSKNVPDTTEEDATFKSTSSSQLISHPGAKTEEEKNLNVIKSTDDKKPFNEDGTEKCNEIESNSDENLPAAIQQHVPESESVLAIKTVGTRSESEEGHFDAESDSALNHATEINERTKESPKSEESESFHSAASSLVGINEDPLESMSIVSQKSSEPYITAVQSQSSMVSSNEQLQSADIAPNFSDTNTQKQKEEDKTTSPTVSSESLIEDNNKVWLDDLQKVSQEEAKSDEKSNGLEKETYTQEPKEEVKTTPSTISPEPLIDSSKEVYSLEDQKVSQQIAKSDGKRVLGELTLRKPLEREINMTGIGLQHMNLNPGISKAPVPRPMVPFCKDTLLIIYANSELIEKENIIENFLETEERKENHPFEDIISSFLRARKSLILAEEEVMKFQTDYLQYQDQVWITSKANMQAKGVCGDGHTCKTTHLYDVVNFSEENFHKMKTSLENIRHNLQNQLALQSYSVQLARLQVDTYLHNLFNECPLLRDIPKDAPISGLLVDYGIRERQQINRLKDCVTVLFHFHRKPISDQEFINSIRQWTQKLVAALLKIATLEDHLFVLNHVLRCPAGVGQWAANLIQIPPFPKQQPSSNIVCPELNHLIACLAFILQPIKGRERFLSHMKEQSDPKEPGGNSSAWIMVDSDGEEDEDPQNAWLYLKENDVVDFLRQIPLNVLFQRILMIEEQSSGKLHYDINRTDDKIMLRVFAICRCLIDLLDCGLQSFSIMRYRQLNKRIGRSIRQTVQYVSNHWESFHNRFSGVLPMDIMERIDLEYSQFFLQATNCILHAQKLGCWQFMTEMPYHTVTKEMSWQLMWLFHQNVRDYINVDQMPKETECKQILTDKNSRQQLCDNIQNLSVSESIYLMTAIMNLSEARSPDQSDLIQVATLSIFEVCYVCNQTREQFSKAGREILASLAVTHPFIVSLLIHATNEHMAQIGQMAKYLYSDMPMESWIPREPDMDILSNWLLSPSMIEPQHLAARAIIACINWGHDKEERHLLLPSSFHKRCAVLLSEAYGKFVFSRSVGYWFLDGMKQAAAAVKQQETLEQQFHNGAWDITLKLHLHMGSLPHSDYLLAMSGGGPPELSADNMLLAISKGVKDRNPLACYVAIMSSKIGHSFGEFLSQGLDALQVLSDSHNYRQAHHVLFYTCSLFMERPDPLIQNDIFTRIFQTLLSADESFLKVCKLWSSDFPGPMLKLFVSMIECKIQKCSQKSTAEMVKLLHLWIKAVLHLPKWYSDRNACYLLDMLVRCSFAFKVNLETLESQFKPAFENHYKESTQHGTVSSFVNWVSSGTYCTFGTSLTEKLYSPGDFPWLTFLLLTVELKSENESKVWEAFREDIHMDPKLAFEQILKKAASKLKLDYCPALNSLNIFGWANLCLETDMDHPLLPLIWQRFFLLFLGRSLNPSSLQQRASVGEKLFETGKYYSQRKKMKKKLKEIAQFHLKRVSEITASEIQDIREQDLPNTDTSDSYHAKKEFHQELARIYQTYELWIEEPVLHDSKLYLPALPPQYNADLLLKLFQNNTDLWLMFIDYDRVIHSVNESSAYWLQSLQGSSSSQLPKDSGRNKGAKSASQRILERLTKHDTPEPLPPTSPVLGAGVPETGINILHNKSNVMHIIKMDLSVLQDFAESFERRVSHHVACDEDFNKLVPKLFYNQLKQVQLTIPCKSMLNPLHKCINPAVVVINVSEKSKVENIQRQMDENRAEFKQLMAQGVSPPPQKICVSAVHVENIITEFIKLSRATTDANKKAYYSDIASNLFFHLAESFDINVQFYPPTKQFFSACLDILGMEFIQKDPSQTESVLEFSLQNPSMAGHISPHFVPLNRPQRYITMYERLVQILQRDAPELVFSLLTKFDINLWMTSHDLTVKEVQRFSEVLGAALCACGPDMEDKTSLVFELYKSHLKILLLHNFPSNVPLVVDLILKGTVDQRLHVDCIQLLYKECFKSTFMKGDESSSAAFVPVPSTLLSIETLRGIMKQFAGFYSHLRLSSTELSSFGLYSQMMPYVPVYIDLFRDISICSLQLVSYGLNVENASQALLSCWQSVIDLYIPWMQTLVFDNKFLFPWIQEDAENAKSVLDSFCSVISQFHQVFSGYLMPYQMSVLCLLWQYYCQILCIKQTPSHVTMVFAATFKQLPWEQLRPDIHTINLMLKLKDVNSADSFELLAEIVCKMNWNEIVQYYHDNHYGPGFSHVLSCVLTLLIQCFGDQKHIEIPELTWCMQKAESYDWSQLSFDSFRHASNWLLQTCDPICVIQGRSSPIAQGIRLLKCASGFDVQSSRLWNNELSMKRQSYVHTAVQLICQCTYTEEVKSETLSTAILNFLTEIETVESSVVNPMFQRGESQDIMKNFLGLLNNCNPDNNSQTTVMTTILDWLRGSQKSILLIPFIKASFCSLASHQHIIIIVEECIHVFLNAESESGVKWDPLLEVIQVPDLNPERFLEDALQEGAFLLLYAHLVLQEPLLVSPAEKQKMISSIINWIRNAKPSPTKEAKILMLWYKALERVLHQIDCGLNQGICIPWLNALIITFQMWGEDRASEGLLGAIGLGKKSPLSLKFRVIARALAALLSNQVLNQSNVRLQPSDPMPVNNSQNKALTKALQDLRTNRSYQAYLPQIQVACDQVSNPNTCLYNSVQLLAQLACEFYPSEKYLTTIASSRTVFGS